MADDTGSGSFMARSAPGKAYGHAIVRAPVELARDLFELRAPEPVEDSSQPLLFLCRQMCEQPPLVLQRERRDLVVDLPAPGRQPQYRSALVLIGGQAAHAACGG